MDRDPSFTDILACPENHMQLAMGSDELTQKINCAIAQGTVTNRARQVVASTLEGVLVRSDAELAYPIREGIPSLLVDEAISLKQFARI